MARRLLGASSLSVCAFVALSAPVAGQTTGDVFGGASQRGAACHSKAAESADEPVMEYACHGGNYAMSNILSGELAVEREEKASAAAKK